MGKNYYLFNYVFNIGIKMNPIQKEILSRIAKYWDEYPSLRFTQLLQTTKINKIDELGLLRDNYYVTDEEVLSRISEVQL